MNHGKSPLLDRDKLTNANQAEVAGGCVNIFDRIQGWPKETQLLSLACAFLLACTASNVPAQEVFTAGTNLMADPLTSSGLGLQFQAMQFHLKTETLA